MRHFICGFLLLLLQATISSAAPPEPDQLRDRLETSVEEASKVGTKTASLQTERQQLLQEIQDFELKAAWADYQLEKHSKWLATEKANIGTLNANLQRAAQAREQLEPLLEVLYADLEAHVEADLPFHETERRNRLAHIRSTLDDPQASLPDRFRRVMESIQVELDYGYTVDVGRKLVQRGDTKTEEATTLRLGRLALFRLLGNNSRLERFDRASGQWLEIADQSILEVEKALEIADKKRVSTLLYLPVGTLPPHGSSPQPLPIARSSEVSQ